MLWSDFEPYVHPFVIGCPEPVMTHHIRLAAIEFAKKTLCWNVWLEDATTDGTSYVELDPGTGNQIVKVKKVLINGLEWGVSETTHGISLEAAGDQTSRYCYTLDNKSLFINPIQPSGVTVKTFAALTPTIKASKLDSAMDEHIQDIADGAIARIKRINGQTFSDMTGSAVHEAAFRSRINVVGAKVARGQLAAKLIRKPRFI